MPKKPLDHLEADATLDADAPVEVEMAGHTLVVKSVKDWPASGLRALKENVFDIWAEKCLAKGSYTVWQQVDPTLTQCEEFFSDWNKATGQSAPE